MFANPGMISSDLALDSVLSRAKVGVQLDRFTLEGADAMGSLEYRQLTDVGMLDDYSAIIFWGDFQHDINFAGQDLLRRARRKGEVDPRQFVEQWLQLMFLAEKPELQRKSICFGETLYGLSSLELGMLSYGRVLRRFLAAAADVQFRDPISTALAQQLAPSGRIGFGCDCAFLLDANSSVLGPAIAAAAGGSRPYIATAFGRSGIDEQQQAFAKQLAEGTGCDLVALNWLRPAPDRALDSLAENISLVRGAQFVVTDIYHLAVTTIREGRPVLAMGWGSSRGTTTLADKKKELLMRSHFGSHLYVFLEAVQRGSKESVTQALEAVRIEQRAGRVHRLAKEQAARSERRFLQALEGLAEAT